MGNAKSALGESAPRPGDWRLDAAAAALFGLVPVIGVAFWGWSAFALIFLFWLENIVIGVRHAIAMLATFALKHGPLGLLGGVPVTAFFCFHYGAFCAGHGAFVFTMFGSADPAIARLAPYAFDDAAGSVRAALDLYDTLLLGAAVIAVWQLLQLILYFARKEYRAENPMSMMGQPYPRIVILHVTIIFGGMLVMAMGWPIAGVILLAAFKLIADVGAIYAARDKASGAARSAPPEDAFTQALDAAIKRLRARQ